jgi:hypothetical protein
MKVLEVNPKHNYIVVEYAGKPLAVSVHPAKDCANDPACVIHKPSANNMRDWPMNFRNDKRGLIERVCTHGVGHPDLDSASFFIRTGHSSMAAHGCDGCCHA